MCSDNIKKNLEEIKEELKSADQETSESLLPLISKLESQLEAEDDDLADVKENLERFEVAHPALTEMLNRLADLLSGIGI